MKRELDKQQTSAISCTICTICNYWNYYYASITKWPTL